MPRMMHSFFSSAYSLKVDGMLIRPLLSISISWAGARMRRWISLVFSRKGEVASIRF